MTYEAQVFQILIASPGDVQDERKVLADVIYEWNSVNSRDRKVVLLPLRWETHSSPEMGSSAQAVINSQVVDQCDMAIGVFWTRLGTPTSEAESGTAEEIERVGNAGKHVMLYFSKAKVDMDQLDINEYVRLKEFKAKTYPQGLVESYENIIDFREKLTRQLAIKLLTLMAEHSREQVRETVDISKPLAMVLGNPAEVLASPAIIRIPKIICTNPGEIPPFEEDVAEEEEQTNIRIGTSKKPNRLFYRELVDFFAQQSAYRKFRFGLENLAQQGVRDIYADIRIEAVAGHFRIIQAPPPPRPPRKFVYEGVGGVAIAGRDQIIYNYGMFGQAPMLELKADESGEERLEMTLPLAQVGRTIFFPDEFIIETSNLPAVAMLHATAYSSNFQPFSWQTKIEVNFMERKMSYQQILEEVQGLLASQI